MDKIFVSANDLLVDTFHLALGIEESEFTPNFILGIWHGGASISLTIQEYLSYRGIHADQLAIRVETQGTNGSTRYVADKNMLEFLHTRLTKKDALLIVDDVFASGHHAQAVVEDLRNLMGEDAPEIKLASIWYSPQSNETNVEPDFYLRTTERRVVFPHELAGLTEEEMRIGKPQVATLVAPQLDICET